MLSWQLAWRLLSHSSNRFARFVTWVSFLGLALGVTVLTVVVTVMNGFDQELKTRLLKAVPHITAPGPDRLDDLRARLSTDARVTSSGRYFRGVGALTIQGRILPVSMVGVESGSELGLLESIAPDQRAALDLDVNGLIIGRGIARALGVLPGDEVTVVTASVRDGVVRPRTLGFTLRGTFSLGAEPDYNLALVNLARFPGSTWNELGEIGTQFQLADPLSAPSLRDEIQLMRPELDVRSWQDDYGELFQAVSLEKSMMFVLLLLVVAVAAFNIIAGQSMLVNDKRRSIAILRTMGASRGDVRLVFLIQGACISLLGTFLGLGLGLLAADHINAILDGMEALTGLHLLDGSFFVEVPTRVLPSDLITIALLSIGLCLLSAWQPANRAAALDPVVALH